MCIKHFSEFCKVIDEMGLFTIISRYIIPRISLHKRPIFLVWMSVWINKMLWMIPYFMLIYRVDLTICFPTIGIIDLEVMYFRMSDSNVCSSWDSIGRTNIFFVLRIIPPKSHCPLTSRLQWYCRRLNFASSISTIIPSPPIWLFDC